MSASSGNLLFYTDGSTVYTSNNLTMPNGTGLMGNSSSTQSAIIVPNPGNSNQFYIFTVPSVGGQANGLRFSIVDMSLNFGLGDVIAASKNTLVVTNVSERVTAVKQANGNGYWIVTKLFNSLNFNAFLLGPGGLNFTPVVSVGLSSSGNIGYLKANAQATRIGLANYSFITPPEVYDFNASTGVLSNGMLLNIGGNSYGLEFSSDGNKIYISGVGLIFQFNLLAGTAAQINSSQFQYSVSSNGIIGAIQLGPDGKLYVSRFGESTLDVFNFPNLLGAAAGFVQMGFTLNTGATCSLGLPTFVSTFLNPVQILFGDTCFGDTTNFTLSDTTNIDSVRWNFNDPSSGGFNTSTSLVTSHLFTTPGYYSVQVVVHRGAQHDSTTTNVHIEIIPDIQLSNDTSICEGDTVGVFVNSSNLNFLWSNGSTDSTIQIVQTGTYWAQVSNACGMDADTVAVDTVFPAIVHFGNDTLLCDGDSVLLIATIMNGTYIWSNGTTDSTYMVHSQNVYRVTATNFCGVDYDTIFVDYLTPPHVNLGNDTVLCNGQSVFFSLQDTLGVYLWENGQTSVFRSINQQGQFWAQTSNQCGVSRDTIEIYKVFFPTAFIGNDTVLCFEDTLQLNDTDLFTTYLWQNGTVDSAFTVMQQGTYWLQKSNACGTIADTIAVLYDTIPKIDLGPDTAFCISNPYGLDGTFSRGSYLWQDGSTNATFLATATGTYWVETTNLCGVGSDTLYINFHEPISFELGNDTAICYYDSLLVNIASNNATYSWNTGETDSTIWIFGGNYYEGTATNLCGSYSDNINLLRIDIPAGTFPLSTELCDDQTFEAIVTSNNSDGIFWNDVSIEFARTLSESGKYKATLYNVCATYTDSFTLDFQAYPTINLGLDTVICYGDEIEFTVDSLDRYAISWSSGNTTKTERINYPQTIEVIVSTSAGCSTSDEVWIDDCGGRLYIPTAFTPDGSGLNDKFVIVGEHITFYELFIFNQWGDELFRSKDISYSWDGSYKGQQVPIGVYSYNLSYLDPNTNTLKNVKGRVTVLR